MRLAYADAEAWTRTPIRKTLSACCASAANGAARRPRTRMTERIGRWTLMRGTGSTLAERRWGGQAGLTVRGAPEWRATRPARSPCPERTPPSVEPWERDHRNGVAAPRRGPRHLERPPVGAAPERPGRTRILGTGRPQRGHA